MRRKQKEEMKPQTETMCFATPAMCCTDQQLDTSSIQPLSTLSSMLCMNITIVIIIIIIISSALYNHQLRSCTTPPSQERDSNRKKPPPRSRHAALEITQGI